MSDVKTTLTRKAQASETKSSAFFDSLRQGFAFVCEHADDVQIDMPALKTFAQEVLTYPAPDTFDDTHHFISGNAEADYAYVLLLDSVNFGSGYDPVLRSEKTLQDGGFYFTMAARLKRKFEDDPLTLADVMALTLADVAEIFGFSDMLKSTELATLYLDAMQKMADTILRNGGSFTEFVESMNSDVGKCVEILIKQPLFKDESLYKGQKIGFYKRAQITAADLHLSAKRRGVTLFNNIDNLTLFADNAVPHVLYRSGVLRYSDKLAAKIERGEVLSPSSPKEVEIRGCAAHATELIASEIGWCAMDVDHRLWHRSEDGDMRALPTHRTYSIFY